MSSLQHIAGSNSALALNCTSTGSPAMNVVWMKDGICLENYTTSQIMRDGVSSTYDNLLEINTEPSELAGVYSCRIHDSLGHNSEPATIQVNGVCQFTNYNNVIPMTNNYCQYDDSYT